MRPTVTAFADSPDRGRGLARDMAVRWAMEELDLAYDVRRLTFAQIKEPAHRALHPFGQIPTYQLGDLVLFESAAIVLHLAQSYAGLLPLDATARARAIAWMFAAVATVEPVVVQREVSLLLERDQPWHAQRLPIVEERICQRLHELDVRLGDTLWLEGGFSAGDLLMVQVLRRLTSSTLLADFPRLLSYVARAQARPAFQRAFEAQRPRAPNQACGISSSLH